MSDLKEKAKIKDKFRIPIEINVNDDINRNRYDFIKLESLCAKMFLGSSIMPPRKRMTCSIVLIAMLIKPLLTIMNL